MIYILKLFHFFLPYFDQINAHSKEFWVVLTQFWGKIWTNLKM